MGARLPSAEPVDDAVAGLGSRKKFRRANGRAAATRRYRVDDLCVGFAGGTRTGIEGLKLGAHCCAAPGLAVAQVTETVQHRTVLNEYQQQREQPGE